MVADQAPQPRPSGNDEGDRDPRARDLPAPATEASATEERGGEAACWARLVCPECGAMTTEGHRPGCQAGAAGAG